MAISNLPRTLDETYERIFQLIPEEDQEFVKLALGFICSNNDLRPLPIMAKVLLEAISFNLHSPDDSENGDVSFYTHDTLQDRCGCLISLTSNDQKEYVSLAHYTVKEFLYSDRITRSTAADFALSDKLVRSTLRKTVLEVVTREYSNSDLWDLSGQFPEPPAMDFLETYAILATDLIRYLWDDWIGEKNSSQLLQRSKAVISSPLYLLKTRGVFERERQAAVDYHNAAGIVTGG